VHTPLTCTPPKPRFLPTNTTLSLNIFTIEKDIEEALANLETQDKPNYSTTAKKHKVGCTTLMQRH